MHKYFNVFLEFDHIRFHSIIEKAITDKVKGFVCVVDGNVLTMANRDETYRKIVNNALVNTCDGSSIAFMINLIHNKKFQAYTGSDIFNHYIGKGYRQLFLGNTEELLKKLRLRFKKEGLNTSPMRFYSLPFLKVDEFDYNGIGIND